MDRYTLTKTFELRYTDVDFRDEMKPSALLACFLEAACDSADLLGFGYQDIAPRDFGFLVSNFHFELFRPIALREKVSFETWPLPPGKALFFREFVVRAGEEIVARASSRWCLYHLREGKILPASALSGQDYSKYRTDKSVESVSWKISSVERTSPCFRVLVGIDDYDHYLHVNNTKYADYIFSCFTLEEWSARRLKCFTVSFLRQCHAGDEIVFYRDLCQNAATVSGYVGENCVVSARLDFEEEA